MIESLRKLGHEVRVVAPAVSRQGAMGAKVGWVHRLKGAFPPALYEVMELVYSMVEYRRLARAVREFKPDVIYERYNLFLLAGLMAKRRFGLPLLLEVNSPLAHERGRYGGLSMKRLARWAEGTVWRGVDHVLPVTKVLAGYVAAYGVPNDRVTVISNGVNEAHFIGAASTPAAKAALQLSDKLVLGFTGFLRDWHGVDSVIRWMAQPSVPTNVHLLIVGDGPARAGLERLAAEHNIADRVTFTGVVSRECVPDHVAAFDVALQPAVVPYASPLKIFEYLALGKAIIAPRQANLEEVLTDGHNVLFFNPGDPNGFFEALTRIVKDHRLRDALAAGAAASIHEQRLTWLDQAKRVAALCARLARNRDTGWVEGTPEEPVARSSSVTQAAKRDVTRRRGIESERVR